MSDLGDRVTKAIINAWHIQNDRPHYAPSGYKLEDESETVIAELRKYEYIEERDGELSLTGSARQSASAMTA